MNQQAKHIDLIQQKLTLVMALIKDIEEELREVRGSVVQPHNAPQVRLLSSEQGIHY